MFSRSIKKSHKSVSESMHFLSACTETELFCDYCSWQSNKNCLQGTKKGKKTNSHHLGSLPTSKRVTKHLHYTSIKLLNGSCHWSPDKSEEKFLEPKCNHCLWSSQRQHTDTPIGLVHEEGQKSFFNWDIWGGEIFCALRAHPGKALLSSCSSFTAGAWGCK